MTRARGRSRSVQYGARTLMAAVLATAVALSVPAGSGAVPPRPPSPSEDRIEAERTDARAMAERVGELANRLAATDSRLRRLSARVEVKLEDANKARVDLRRAEQAHARAKETSEFAAAGAAAAARRVHRQRDRLDDFVASSYQQGSRLGSVPAFVGARTPRQMLDRAALLDAISESQLDVLDELRRARAEKANKDSLARQALQEAEAKRAAADRAREAAEAAKDAAVAARAAQREQARQLEAEKARVTRQLEQARANVAGLTQQRERYQEWLAAKKREERAAAAAAAQAAEENLAQAAPPPGGGNTGSGSAETDSGSDSSAVETVVQRALSQVGVTYAWGGGNAHGPTRGIRDGGVADAHGDYLKIGFDCSGLMVYAFAGVGIELAHYSGYQYQSGRKVPLSRMQRGDMLFWDDGGSVHHVALYLGNGRMVEAPYSGAQVRVTSVRYDGIAPYAVRLL